jgi:hypothetical protein
MDTLTCAVSILVPYGADYKDYRSNGTRYENTYLMPLPTIISNPQRSAEYVACSHGVEARYPLLDPAVVQEFLWLTPHQKAVHPRKPLYDYMMRRSYPIDFGEKKGFESLGLTRDSSNRARVLGQLPQFVITSPRQGACTTGQTMDVEWDVEHVNRRAAVPFSSNFSQHTVCLVLDDAAQETCVDRPSLDINLFPTLNNLQPGCHRLIAWLQDSVGITTSSVGRTFFEVVEDGLCIALNCAHVASDPSFGPWNFQREVDWLEVRAGRGRKQPQSCGV